MEELAVLASLCMCSDSVGKSATETKVAVPIYASYRVIAIINQWPRVMMYLVQYPVYVHPMGQCTYQWYALLRLTGGGDEQSFSPRVRQL